MSETAKPKTANGPDIDDIFRQLEAGAGRELVTEENVDALIERARAAGRTVLETELKEWAASC